MHAKSLIHHFAFLNKMKKWISCVGSKTRRAEKQ